MSKQASDAGAEIKVGQIWLEVDPRRTRFVRVENFQYGRRGVSIRTVFERDDGGWQETRNSRLSYADPERFNGKRGGYSLHREAA